MKSITRTIGSLILTPSCACILQTGRCDVLADISLMKTPFELGNSYYGSLRGMGTIGRTIVIFS